MPPKMLETKIQPPVFACYTYFWVFVARQRRGLGQFYQSHY